MIEFLQFNSCISNVKLPINRYIFSVAFTCQCIDTDHKSDIIRNMFRQKPTTPISLLQMQSSIVVRPSSVLDISRSARDITQGMQSLAPQLPGQSETFTKQLLRIVFKFSGEPQTEDVIESIYQEALKIKSTIKNHKSKKYSIFSRNDSPNSHFILCKCLPSFLIVLL